jgi:endoglycosylceramidase
MKSLTFFVSLTLAVALVAGSGFRAIPGTGQFYKTSEKGQSFLFHGVNVVHKAPGFSPITTVELQTMRRLGFNLIRYGFLWFNVETSPGVYNQTFLQELKAHVDFFYAHGYHVFLDMHQDCYSSYFCAGFDGLPLAYGHPPNSSEFWIGGNKSFPLPLVKPDFISPTPDGFGPWGAPNCNNLLPQWSMCYPTYALGAASQRLYSNTDGLADNMGKMWQQVAAVFKGHPAVIGYELINEPWLGQVPLNLNELDPLANPEFWDLWFSGVADRKNMAPLYDLVAGMIRQIDNDTTIFFEPASGGSVIDAQVGFVNGPGGPSYDQAGLNVLSYHTYCPLIQADVPIPTNGSDAILAWLWKELTLDICKHLTDDQFTTRHREVRRLGVGAVLSEFGAIPHTHAAAEDMTKTLDAIDKIMHSWTFWEHHDLETSPQYILDAMTRSFPQSVPGTLLSFGHNQQNQFVLEYLLSAQNTLATSSPTALVFVSAVRFPNGFNVDYFPPCCVQTQAFNTTSNILTVVHDMTKIPAQSVVRMVISAKHQFSS